MQRGLRPVVGVNLPHELSLDRFYIMSSILAPGACETGARLARWRHFSVSIRLMFYIPTRKTSVHGRPVRTGAVPCGPSSPRFNTLFFPQLNVSPPVNPTPEKFVEASRPTRCFSLFPSSCQEMTTFPSYLSPPPVFFDLFLLKCGIDCRMAELALLPSSSRDPLFSPLGRGSGPSFFFRSVGLFLNTGNADFRSPLGSVASIFFCLDFRFCTLRVADRVKIFPSASCECPPCSADSPLKLSCLLAPLSALFAIASCFCHL